MNEEKEIRFIDLFAGIGGFALGLERANYNRGFLQGQTTKGIKDRPDSEGRSPRLDCGFRCVWSCDNNKHANQVYTKHFGETNHHSGDIRGVNPRDIPDFDLLCSGFPCQSFSVAGKGKGFQDTRGSLFFEISRIAEAKRPSLLLLENVKGLLSNDRGQTFQTILQELGRIGYWTEWQVLNSRDWLPQNRERVFIIGHLRGSSSRPIFPVGETDGVVQEESGERPNVQEEVSSITNRLAPCLVHNLYGGFKEGIRVFKDYSPTIRTPAGGGHLPMVVADRSRHLNKKGRNLEAPKPYSNALSSVQKDNLLAIRMVRSEKGKKARQEAMQEGKDYTPFGNEYRELTLSEENISGCLTGAYNPDALVGNELMLRKLTEVECERLQGFPDNWTEGISSTQRYKCLGNAVTVPVITFLGKKIREAIE